jgi:hypothetical protein
MALRAPLATIRRVPARPQPCRGPRAKQPPNSRWQGIDIALLRSLRSIFLRYLVMVVTLIVTFIALAFVAILFREPGDLLLAKLRPRPRDRGEEMRNKLLPFLIMPVTSQELSVPSLPIGAAKSASPVQNTPRPAWHGAANGARTDDVADEEWLPPRPGRATVRETARTIPVTPLADAPGEATVVFQRPVDRPVQILPGRFEVVAGDPSREDIRFIGQMDTEARLMIGRNVGAPHKVVTLQSPTVSRGAGSSPTCRKRIPSSSTTRHSTTSDARTV